MSKQEQRVQQETEEPEDGVPIVLVTGASGFIATHLIKQLLEQGNYRVRGTVRSKKREDKVITLTNYLQCYFLHKYYKKWGSLRLPYSLFSHNNIFSDG